MGELTLRRAALDGGRLSQLQHGVLLARTSPAVFRVRGSGALTCLQGLLTNDLAKPGPGAVVYGALLTPKGMILADLWVYRGADEFLLVAEAHAREPIRQVFARGLPPRLAKAEDLTGAWEATWLYGDLAIAALAAAHLPVIDGEGHGSLSGDHDRRLALLRPTSGAPFRALLLGSEATLDEAEGALERAGALAAGVAEQEAARVLAGWPRLGAEISDKTLPQEVRFDENGGVSYTKGCYTGQETVARLHFRGHANRELRGIVWEGTPLLEDEAVRVVDGKEVGRVSSVLDLERMSLGLAVVRREVAPGTTLTAGNRAARVVALPFDLGLLSQAAG